MPITDQDAREVERIMLIYKSSITIIQENKHTIPYSEVALWKLQAKSHCFSILGIYHPPAATTKTSDTVFTEELADLISTLKPENRYLMVSGDLNIHVNDKSSDDAIFFIDAMLSLGLDQHVHTSMHQAGNILDLILTDSNSLPISKCIASDFISDHRAVICQTSLNRAPLNRKKTRVQKITPDRITAFAKDLDTSNIMSADTLDAAVKSYESELTNKFNTHFPIVEKTFTQ